MPNVINRLVEKSSPVTKMATTICSDGPIYCKNPSTLSGSALAALEKKYSGDIVIKPAPISNKMYDILGCKKVEVPSISQAVKKNAEIGSISAVSRKRLKKESI